MYRRPKFLEILDEVRQEMSREVDYDVDLFAEMIRNGQEKKIEGKNESEKILTFQNKLTEDFAPETKR